MVVENSFASPSTQEQGYNYFYDRGDAYLKANRGTAAAAAFQQILNLNHPGLVRNCFAGALAHFHLGRPRVMMGDVRTGIFSRGFRKSLYDLRMVAWAPIFKQARAEYANPVAG